MALIIAPAEAPARAPLAGSGIRAVLTGAGATATNPDVAAFVTLNTDLLDVRLFGLLPVYPAAPHVEERLAALPEALAEVEADVVCLQEVFRKPHRAYLAASLEAPYPFAAGLRSPGMPLGRGLMVLSRHPIDSARLIEFRAAFAEERLAIRKGMLDCVVRLPDLGRCRVINVHLAGGGLFGHPESVRAEDLQRRQIAELLRRAGEPGPDVTIIAGDFNCGPHSSLANYLQVVEAGFRDAFAAAPTGAAAARDVTWAPANPLITGQGERALPPQRIDHVFLSRDGADRCRLGPARIVLRDAPVRLAHGRRVPVSDHYGLLAEIAAAG